MTNKENILNELNEFSSSIADLPSHNIYSVPSNYFEHFPKHFLQVIHEQEDLAAKILLETSNPIPPFYFENLADTILLKIKDNSSFKHLPIELKQELREHAPLLIGISKDPVYTLPKNYFENFKVDIAKNNQHTSHQQQIITLRKNSFKWIMYAAAATIIGIIVTNLFLESNSISNNLTFEKNIHSLTDDEIAHYLIQSQHQATAISPIISDEDIDSQNFLDNTSDEEINQYLNQHTELEKPVIKDI